MSDEEADAWKDAFHQAPKPGIADLGLFGGGVAVISTEMCNTARSLPVPCFKKLCPNNTCLRVSH